QVEITAVGGRLEGVGGHRQSDGGARQASSARGVGGARPAAEVDLAAVAHKKGRGRDVLPARAADPGAPQRGTQVATELVNELRGVGVGVLAGRHRVWAGGLPHHVNVIVHVQLHEVAQV